jgi:class 3 adenylate cyclase
MRGIPHGVSAVNLVERFIEVTGWSTSRKTALLMGITLPAHLFGWVALIIAGIDNQRVNMIIVHGVVAGGAIVIVLCLLCGLLAARAGKEGRWTGYMVAVLYGGYVFAVIQTAGLWSTAFFAWYPIGVIVLALWFDERIGWFAFVLGLVHISVLAALQWTDHLPYAPALIDRSVDSQQAVSWAAGNLVPILLFFGFCFTLSLLMLASRRLQTAQLREAHQKMERSNHLIRRYVPSQLAEMIVEGEHSEEFKPERVRLTVFFSDLVGFTETAEQLDPEELSRVLNEYFSEMTRIAHRHGGTVDELSGDAILIFFGAPKATSDADHARRAVRMALEMQEVIPRLNAAWRRDGIDHPLSVRMGINTGVVTIGSFGSHERMKYAVLGKHVNVAARLQSHCEPGKVLLSQATWLLVREEIPCLCRGETSLKGIQKPVAVYEVQAAG